MSDDRLFVSARWTSQALSSRRHICYRRWSMVSILPKPPFVFSAFQCIFSIVPSLESIQYLERKHLLPILYSTDCQTSYQIKKFKILLSSSIEFLVLGYYIVSVFLLKLLVSLVFCRYPLQIRTIEILSVEIFV